MGAILSLSKALLVFDHLCLHSILSWLLQHKTMWPLYSYFLACSRMDHKGISTQTRCGVFPTYFLKSSLCWNIISHSAMVQVLCAGDCDRWSPSSYSITLSALQCPVVVNPLYLHTNWECPPPPLLVVLRDAPAVVGGSLMSCVSADLITAVLLIAALPCAACPKLAKYTRTHLCI